MSISLPERTITGVDSLTPREIVASSTATSSRRRPSGTPSRCASHAPAELPADLAEDVAPKNILMIGPTGVGKTGTARRLPLAQSPFIKVEASKFTEVCYVGRDVESMVRDPSSSP